MMNKQKNDNVFIQNHMYEGKHSKSVYKGFKSCMIILACLLFFGWVKYPELLQYEAGYSSKTLLFWLYKYVGAGILKLSFVVLCVLLIGIGIWDVRRLKRVQQNNLSPNSKLPRGKPTRHS